MALISLSDWLDRFGDAASTAPSTSELESLRIRVSEEPATAPNDSARVKSAAGWRIRLGQAWRRAFCRLRRQPTGQA